MQKRSLAHNTYLCLDAELNIDNSSSLRAEDCTHLCNTRNSVCNRL